MVVCECVSVPVIVLCEFVSGIRNVHLINVPGVMSSITLVCVRVCVNVRVCVCVFVFACMHACLLVW